MNNRVTAQGYTAWDNIFSGNSYNLRLWLAAFKIRLREGLVAQIRAIVAREGMSAMSGIVSLAIVFATITVVAMQNAGDTVLLVGLATTLPRQIEMSYELHLLATGWNDFIAIWTRFDPGNIISYSRHLPTLFLEFFGRYQHGEIGLSACAGESSSYIGLFALRILHSQDEHMLC